MLHFAFIFLRYVPVASRNKIAFRSGLQRALERSLLRTKSSSALDFGELWRGCFLEQNRIPPWTDVSRLERYCTNVLLARLTKVRR
jgi:hypothetical protein